MRHYMVSMHAYVIRACKVVAWLGFVAQRIERSPPERKVEGSNPFEPTGNEAGFLGIPPHFCFFRHWCGSGLDECRLPSLRGASPQAPDCFEGCVRGCSVVRCAIDGGVAFLGKHAVLGMVGSVKTPLLRGYVVEWIQLRCGSRIESEMVPFIDGGAGEAGV